MTDGEPPSLFSITATGDTDPWANHLPLAWRLCADTGGQHDVPVRHARWSHDSEVAWWTPLFHLTLLGLGWSHPFVGLARWHEMGRPTEETILQVIARWWGPHLHEILGWAYAGHAYVNQHLPISKVGPIPEHECERLLSPYRQWAGALGPDTDSMHAMHHPPFEMHPSGMNSARYRFAGASPERDVLVCDAYTDWPSRLRETPGQGADRQNRRVEVVVRPLGWLGTYRQSTQTGRWFRGQHRWHVLGN
jgi:hypothetical protein